MTTEIKPGKWRLKDGREVVVLRECDEIGAMCWLNESQRIQTVRQSVIEGAEYLGPAVIGEVMMHDTAYWIMRANEAESQCKDLESETVATRDLLEKSEERCEELAKELDVFRDTINGLSCENRRLKRGEFTEDEFQNLCNGMTEDDARRFKAGCFAYWPKLFGKQGVAYEFKDGVEIYRFKSVTVMVRGEREAWCYCSDDRWFALCENMEGSTLMREDAEAWCREQLEPKWREATEGDVGKACRCRDDETDEDWDVYERLVAVIRHEKPYVVDDEVDVDPALYRYCEVQE